MTYYNEKNLQMKRHSLLLGLTLATAVASQAQVSMDNMRSQLDKVHQESAAQQRPTNDILNHLDLGVTMGTTGVGVDVAMPVGQSVQLRTGFTYVPRFSKTMNFGIQVGDAQESAEAQQSKFNRLAQLLNEYTGMTVDDNVDMIGKPSFQNFKFLVDVFPFSNKHWHFTAGFYWGPSRVAYAENATYDATSLVSTAFYNNLYERVKYCYEEDIPLTSTGNSDIYVSTDMYNKFMRYGRMGVHVGDFKNQYVTDEDGNVKTDEQGNPIHKAYRMEPDENNMVSAKIKVNNFRPYVGFGYGGRLMKNTDRYKISFDCGAMFWGGTPRVITHDGTDLAKDVENIGGKVGRYVKLVKAFPVYPVLSLRLTTRLF